MKKIEKGKRKFGSVKSRKRSPYPKALYKPFKSEREAWSREYMYVLCFDLPFYFQPKKSG